ncbi:hypothetical protein ACTJIJ_19730 [Niabella sp. 22666]|uniref:hypothetical protein n=1 Tax=Niabella sp. 22666 TaxID=3453954 RepID=UPI003F867A5A
MIKSFSQFNIKPVTENFIGEKVKVSKILDKEITVLRYSIEPSKYEKGDGKRLKMQIELEGELRIVFSGATFLKQMIQQVPDDGFPFRTTIVKKNEGLYFI